MSERSAENDAPACRVTNLLDRTPCTLLAGHGGLHKGGGWVWLHGTSEECVPACAMCARVLPPAKSDGGDS